MLNSPDSITHTPSQLNVLHGTMEIANQMRIMSQGLNLQGITSRTINYYKSYLNTPSPFELEGIWTTSSKQSEITAYILENVIPNFELFHFHFSTSLLKDHSDLAILNDLQKPVIMHHWGSEVRQLSKALEVNPYAKAKVKNNSYFKNKLGLLSKKIKHCIVPDHELLRYTKDYYENVYVVPSMINLEEYPLSNRTSNDKPLIVHAPTNADIKGTHYVLQAIEKLKLDYDFDFQLVQYLTHDKAKKIYEKADLIIDQLHIGSYGLFAIESMAMGKPVICYISDYMTDFFPDNLPIISANPDTITETLKHTLNALDSLPEIGKKSHDYVKTHHDVKTNIFKISNIYQNLYSN